jgi:hypothetical protein
MRWLNRAILAGLFLSTTVLVASAEELTVASAPPVVVSTEPRAGQTDVAPGTNEIRVTFSRPMRDGSWSSVKLSDTSFPKTTGNPRFLDNQRICVLPVSLEPGKTVCDVAKPAAIREFPGSGRAQGGSLPACVRNPTLSLIEARLAYRTFRSARFSVHSPIWWPRIPVLGQLPLA